MREEEKLQQIKELYSVIWLLTYQFPKHKARINSTDLTRLNKRDCFTVWTDTETGELIIEAKTGGDCNTGFEEKEGE